MPCGQQVGPGEVSQPSAPDQEPVPALCVGAMQEAGKRVPEGGRPVAQAWEPSAAPEPGTPLRAGTFLGAEHLYRCRHSYLGGFRASWGALHPHVP